VLLPWISRGNKNRLKQGLHVCPSNQRFSRVASARG
jgi:hypothetical protein